ncbi:MAG: tripartite tricarboxylate transporter substrate binding protein [Polaromonas sp.]|nr:tripartite tricarboxylate transporter substrate binding protein [Polaromonas sp.]
MPVPPGNAGDIAARALAERLSRNIRQPVIIDNRVGAGGNIGAAFAAKAPADGYTVLIASSGVFTANPHLYKLGFDPQKDFIPVTLIYSGAPMLVTNAANGPKSVQEVIDMAKKDPGKISFASYGSGHISHILGEMFKKSANIDLLHVPYKNSPLTDVMSGQVDLIFESSLLVVGNKERLRPLATVSARRSPRLPDVPAMSEFIPGFEMTGWVGAFVPAGTPPDVVNYLNRELSAAINSPEYRKRLDDQMLDPGGNSPAEFATFVRTMSDKVGQVIRDAKIKAD